MTQKRPLPPFQVNEEDFKVWKEGLVTQVFLHWLEWVREDLKEGWSTGAFTSSEGHASATLNAEAIGKCEALRRAENFSFEDIEAVYRGEK